MKKPPGDNRHRQDRLGRRSAMRAQYTGPVMDYVKKGRAESGLTTITAITSIDITGDTAIVTMDTQNEAMGSRRVTMPLKLEDGWKICRT